MDNPLVIVLESAEHKKELVEPLIVSATLFIEVLQVLVGQSALYLHLFSSTIFKTCSSATKIRYRCCNLAINFHCHAFTEAANAFCLASPLLKITTINSMLLKGRYYFK